jgi:hypothetical protein
MGVVAVGDLVVWRKDPTVPDQAHGRAGVIDMFIVYRDTELDGFVLMTRDLFDLGGRMTLEAMFGIGPERFATMQEARKAAEDVLVRILSDLDTVSAGLRATGRSGPASGEPPK